MKYVKLRKGHVGQKYGEGVIMQKCTATQMMVLKRKKGVATQNKK